MSQYVKPKSVNISFKILIMLLNFVGNAFHRFNLFQNAAKVKKIFGSRSNAETVVQKKRAFAARPSEKPRSQHVYIYIIWNRENTTWYTRTATHFYWCVFFTFVFI